MIQCEIEIVNPKGIHARPSALLVMEAQKHECAIQLIKEERCADAKSILDIMQLEALYKDHLIIKAEGPHEKEAIECISKIFSIVYDD